MIAFALLLALAPSASLDSLGEVTPEVALVEFEGPTSGGAVRLGTLVTRVELELERGEVRRVRVPFSAGELATRDVELRFELESGAARLLEWEDGSAQERWSRLPASLRGRPIPAPGGIGSRPTPLGFAVLGSGLLLVFVFRSRPRLSVLIGLGAAALLLALPTVERVGQSEVVVLEGEGQSGTWIRVRVQRAETEVDPDRLVRLGVVPSDSAVTWTVRESSGARPSWRAQVGSVTGARLIAAESFEGSVLIDPGLDGEPAIAALDFRSTWVREAASGSRPEARGLWARGEPLPTQVSSEAPTPPGWLVAGLPPGTRVLLGELEEADGAVVWVRLTRF